MHAFHHPHNVRGPESTRTSLWQKYESAKLRGRTGAKSKDSTAKMQK